MISEGDGPARFNFFLFSLKKMMNHCYEGPGVGQPGGGWSPGAGGRKMGVSCVGSGQRLGMVVVNVLNVPNCFLGNG